MGVGGAVPADVRQHDYDERVRLPTGGKWARRPLADTLLVVHFHSVLIPVDRKRFEW